MKILKKNRCIIGEGPIWNDNEGLLYFVDGMKKEIFTYNPETEALITYPQEICVAAIAFAKDGRMLVSRSDGAFFLDLKSGIAKPMYGGDIKISHGNDAKVGPDGAFYVGTQSGYRLGISQNIDGKLYRIDSDGNVKALLDDLILPNGLDWSPDERFFYLVDSGTHMVRKYNFDADTGNLTFTGLEVQVQGADGITVNQKGDILVACWGKRCIAVIDPETMSVTRLIDVPTRAPASCGFFGKEMNLLAITTASLSTDIESDTDAGFLFIKEMEIPGRLPYLFG